MTLNSSSNSTPTTDLELAQNSSVTSAEDDIGLNQLAQYQSMLQSASVADTTMRPIVKHIPLTKSAVAKEQALDNISFFSFLELLDLSFVRFFSSGLLLSSTVGFFGFKVGLVVSISLAIIYLGYETFSKHELSSFQLKIWLVITFVPMLGAALIFLL